MTVSFYTLGCKLNQIETEALAQSFRALGFSVGQFPQPAALTIINTCTVTSMSEQKARRVIRKVLRDNPEGLVLATGCYVQMEEEVVAALDAHRLVTLPLDLKSSIIDLPEYLSRMGLLAEIGEPPAVGELLIKALEQWIFETRSHEASLSDPFRYNITDYPFHSRAFLKVQDGCDNQCAYCRVTLARGAAVSLSAEKVIEQLNRMAEAGIQEVVLTGINLACYRSEGLSFGGLLKKILNETQGFRLRLSSLEPEMIKPELLEALSHWRICPHFHLSLQSGSDPILAAMGRRYRTEVFRRAVSDLRTVTDNPFLSADVIAGFPGETPEDHRTTMALLEETALGGLHVFPFSPRPGTRAAEMKNPVPQRIIGERAAELRVWSEQARAAFARTLVGRREEVLLEEGASRRGLCARYQEVSLPGESYPDPEPGKLYSGVVAAGKDQELILDPGL